MNLFKKYKTFDEVLPSFLEGKKIEINPRSYNGYRGRAKVFSEWLKEQSLSSLPLKKISNDDFVRFFHECLINGRGLDRPTVKKYYETISAVLNYAVDVDEIDALPTFKGLKFPKKGRDCSAQLIPEELLPDLLDDIHEHDPQLYVGVMMEYYCGVRPGKEARLIKAGAFNLKEGVLKINANIAKTGKVRYITMSDHFVEICKDYGIENANPNLYVFGKNKNLDTRPVSENMLRYRFNAFREKHNILNTIKLYSFKHQGASNLIKITDLKTVQDHLGHANITSTAHYLKKLSQCIDKNIKNNFPNPERR